MKRLCILALALLLLCGCGKETPVESLPETTAETVTETTAATQPETVPALPVVITKDPTGETLSPGGRTWFVAHADNADSVTWEFLSPDGIAYSVSETMANNPNLAVDVSQKDTIALEKIPLSLNGWSCRARFDGPGGSATTAAATITVKQSEGPYDAAIERYRTAAAARGSGENPMKYGVSEMLSYAAHVGYTKMDLDGNGVEELIIAGIRYDIPEEPVIFEIFTIQDGSAVSLTMSYARSRFYLMQDGRIYHEGSSGAAYSNFSIMQVSGRELRFLNGIYTSDLRPDGTLTDFGYYYTTSNQFGSIEQMAGDNALDPKVAETFLSGWRDAICLPELCFIA